MNNNESKDSIWTSILIITLVAIGGFVIFSRSSQGVEVGPLTSQSPTTNTQLNVGGGGGCGI